MTEYDDLHPLRREYGPQIAMLLIEIDAAMREAREAIDAALAAHFERLGTPVPPSSDEAPR